MSNIDKNLFYSNTDSHLNLHWTFIAFKCLLNKTKHFSRCAFKTESTDSCDTSIDSRQCCPPFNRLSDKTIGRQQNDTSVVGFAGYTSVVKLTGHTPDS